MTSKEYLAAGVPAGPENQQRYRRGGPSAGNGQQHSAPVLGDKVQTSRNADAPFVRSVEKILQMEAEINREIDRLVALKEQIRSVIAAVPDSNERLVLRLRYIQGLTWEQIGLEMNANERTIRRWHGKALLHIAIPKNPIKI